MTAPSPAGWYADPNGSGGQRYYDGAEWTVARPILNDQQRNAILQRELVAYTSGGARVLTQSPSSASVAVGNPTNHVVHVLLAIFTCGLWLPVWLMAAAGTPEKRYTVFVDEYGEVTWR